MKIQKTVQIFMIIGIMGVLILFGIVNRRDNTENKLDIDISVDEDENISKGIESINMNGQDIYADINDNINDSLGNDAYIIVDISGEVMTPGVYELPYGSRIADGITLAGGLTEEASLNLINRAEVLKDGTKLYIPNINDDIKEDIPVTSDYIDGMSNDVNKTSLININKEDVEGLTKIPGIGPVTAEKIISYRDKYGPFGSEDELLNISGIGNKTLDKIRDYITF